MEEPTVKFTAKSLFRCSFPIQQYITIQGGVIGFGGVQVAVEPRQRSWRGSIDVTLVIVDEIVDITSCLDIEPGSDQVFDRSGSIHALVTVISRIAVHIPVRVLLVILSSPATAIGLVLYHG